MAPEESTAEAAPKHQRAMEALARQRDVALQEVERISNGHRDVLVAARRAQRQIDDKQREADEFEAAMQALNPPEAKVQAAPVHRGRPIADNPQA